MLPCRRRIQTLDPPPFQWVAHACFVQPPTRQNAPFSQSPTFANIAKMVQMSISSTEPLESKSGKLFKRTKTQDFEELSKIAKSRKARNLQKWQRTRNAKLQNFVFLHNSSIFPSHKI